MATGETVREAHDQSWTKSLCEIQRHEVIVFRDRASRAWVSGIAKAVEAVAVIAAFGVFTADQSLFA